MFTVSRSCWIGKAVNKSCVFKYLFTNTYSKAPIDVEDNNFTTPIMMAIKHNKIKVATLQI